jgi:hypothetical protein
MSDLRTRCTRFITEKTHRNLRINVQATSLVEFILAEIGRSKAGGVLDSSYPAVAYFKTEADREEFIKAITEANPNIRAKAVL